tara:strand:+ start:1229 stop:1996 length:768 start_codon:yes stop_codon:yes gene_type:complete
MNDKVDIEKEEAIEEKEDRPSKIEILWKEMASAVLPLITSVIAAATLSTFFFDSSILIGKRSGISESEKMFVYLQDGVEKDKFDEEYFNTAFNHFDRKSDGELGKYGRIELIEDFLVYLNTKTQGESPAKTESVRKFLSRIKAVEPFSALPAEERRLMDHLQVLVTNKENLEPVVQTLNELKQVILARHKEYQRIEAQNSWSLPLSFVGVFLTLVFGIWTTVLSVKQGRSRYMDMHREIVEHRSDGAIIRKVYRG